MVEHFTFETVDDDGGLVGNTCLVLDTNKAPRIAYIANRPSGNIVVARKDTSGWTAEVTQATTFQGEANRVAFAVDSGGKYHLAYRDHETENLLYAVGNDGHWVTETVPTSGGLARPVMDVSMQLHPGKLDTEMRDKPHIAYRDMFLGESLCCAVKPGDTWQGHVTKVDSLPDRPTGP